jgi:phenylpyruvate tautomerase PptA (4-oxalocrotonate tautomerase family)
MPTINVRTNVTITPEIAEAVKSELGQAISLIPGKSEQWLQVVLDDGKTIYFAGQSGPSAFVEVSILGTDNRSAYEKLGAEITSILRQNLGIDGNRIYVKMQASEFFTWNGNLF